MTIFINPQIVWEMDDFWVQFLAMRMFWWRIYIDGTTLGSVHLMLRLFRKRKMKKHEMCSEQFLLCKQFLSLVVHLWNKSHAQLRVNWHEHRRLENLGSADPVPCKLLLVPWRGECTSIRRHPHRHAIGRALLGSHQHASGCSRGTGCWLDLFSGFTEARSEVVEDRETASRDQCFLRWPYAEGSQNALYVNMIML